MNIAIIAIFLSKVTRRSRELAYDLEKRLESARSEGLSVKSGFEGELDKLIYATANLTGLAGLTMPGRKR